MFDDLEVMDDDRYLWDRAAQIRYTVANEPWRLTSRSLEIACCNGSDSLVRDIIEYDEDLVGSRSIACAIRNDDASIVKMLLRHIDEIPPELFEYALEHGTAEHWELLLEYGADVKQVSNFLGLDSDAMEFVLENGFPVTTALLHKAVFQGLAVCTKKLIRYGADPWDEIDGNCALRLCYHKDVANVLAEHLDPDDSKALFWVLGDGTTVMVQTLLAHGFRYDLDELAKSQAYDAFDDLLSHGEDDPRLLLLAYNDTDVQQLIDAKVSLQLADNEHEILPDLASRVRHQRITQVVNDHLPRDLALCVADFVLPMPIPERKRKVPESDSEDDDNNSSDSDSENDNNPSGSGENDRSPKRARTH